MPHDKLRHLRRPEGRRIEPHLAAAASGEKTPHDEPVRDLRGGAQAALPGQEGVERLLHRGDVESAGRTSAPMCWHLSPLSRVEARGGERLPDYADSVTRRSLRGPRATPAINGAGMREPRHKRDVGMMSLMPMSA